MEPQPADATETLTVGQRCMRFQKNHLKGTLTFLLPLVFLPLLFVEPIPEFHCMYVVLLMAFYWITEVIPLYVTSLIPIVLFPLFGILDSNAVCLAYFNDALLLFFGGLVVALAIEYCNLHQRIALGTILIVGCSPRRLHFGLIFVTMFLSMWISNSACTAMMCPIIKAVLTELETQGAIKLTTDKPVENEDDPPYPSKSVICYYLGVAYAATIGGCGTLIGTGTNVTFKGLYETRFPETQDVDFISFMAFASIPMVFETALMYMWMQWLYMGWLRPNSPEAIEINVGKAGAETSKAIILQKYKELGRMSLHEVQVLIGFILMIVLMFTRKPGIFTGWADILNAKKIKGSLPLMLIAILLFAVPVNYIFMKYCICRRPDPEGTTSSLVTWKFINANVPWGLLLLLGGGFALAEGVKASGFSVMVGEALSVMKPWPIEAIQFIGIATGVFLTAFSANVAICNILVPVMNELAVILEMHPLYLSLPAALACSMAFHLPVSTPPNAIVQGLANIRTKDMAIAGIGPTIITIIFTILACQTWIYVIWPTVGEFPDWANPSTVAPTT